MKKNMVLLLTLSRVPLPPVPICARMVAHAPTQAILRAGGSYSATYIRRRHGVLEILVLLGIPNHAPIATSRSNTPNLCDLVPRALINGPRLHPPHGIPTPWVGRTLKISFRQAQVPLRSLLLKERQSAEAGDGSSRGDRGRGSNLGGLEPASRLLDNVLATPVPPGRCGSEGSDDDGSLSFFETGDDPHEDGRQDEVEESLPSTVPSLGSSTSSGPPTLSSLSATATPASAVPSKAGGGGAAAPSPAPSIEVAAVPAATATDETKASSALTTVESGGGGGGGGGNSTATSPYDGGGGGAFAFARSGALKAGDGDRKMSRSSSAPAARVESLLGEPKG